MSDSNTTARAGGIGFAGLLTIVLVVLKAFGKISVAWWVCFLPIMISFGLAILVLIIALILIWLSK